MKKKAESDSEIEAVRVFFVKGVEYDSRTGLPWGVTQEQFDKKNADYQKKNWLRTMVKAHPCEDAQPNACVFPYTRRVDCSIHTSACRCGRMGGLLLMVSNIMLSRQLRGAEAEIQCVLL